MGREQPATTGDGSRLGYLRTIDKRVRSANWAVLSRVAGLQVAWGVSLVAGAAVPLVQALDWDAKDAITAVLGFVVVVAQGADRLMARTSGVVQADDAMRRAMARERRLFDARQGPYRDVDDPFAVFVDRVEAVIAEHDGHVAAYSRDLLANSG